ncbi:MAG TPA: WYL domain-containing protein [Acidimicrobiales bacterium]
MSRRAPASRTSASDRVARLLAIVPWVAAHDGPTLDEVSERFGISRRKLLEDLDVLMMVGVPPYTPDTLIDVTIDGDRVWLRFADVFARPLHLTPEQGLALVAAGSASLDLQGGDREGPLATALAKLAAVLGVEVDDAVSVTLGETRPGLLDTLRSAVAERRRLRIDYYAYGRDERTTRDVDPHAVVADDGAWYLHAYCHRAEGPRSFRVDRIVEAAALGETFEPPSAAGEGTDPPDARMLGPEVPRVTLDLEPGARWVVETYPVDSVDVRDDGWLRVRLPVTATPWLERLLVRLGDGARVVEADDDTLVGAGARAAWRILARYRIGPVAGAPR